MPSVKGKGNGGDMRAKAALNGKRVGRPRRSVKIALDVNTAARLQQHMLVPLAGVHTPEDMLTWLIWLPIADLRAALPFLQEARAQCFNEDAQRGLDQLIAALGAVE